MIRSCGPSLTLVWLFRVLAVLGSAEQVNSMPRPSLEAAAKLNEDGYAAVAVLRSDIAMKVFARRLASSLGMRVDDDNAFNGWVPYFSGRLATQTFAKMRNELQHAKWIVADMQKELAEPARANLLRRVAASSANPTEPSSPGAQPSASPTPPKEALAPEPWNPSATPDSATFQTSVFPPFNDTSLAADTIYTEVASKTDAMESRVTAMQEQARRGLEKKRQEFEASLQIQKTGIHTVDAENQKIASDIATFRRQASALQVEAMGLIEANEILRSSLLHMFSKVTLAGDFLEASVNDTADAETEKLERLLAPPKRDLEFYIEEARKDLRSVSLLQSMRVGASNSTHSELILESLADAFERVKQATADGTVKLKASYVAAAKILAEEKANSTQYQGELVEDRAKAEAYMQTMKKAVDYLRSQHSVLEQRISGVEVFGVKLENGVDAVLLQAKRLTEGVE